MLIPRFFPRLAIAFGLAVIAAVASSATAQTTKKAADLARYVPSKGLVGLVEYDGTAAHDAAWRKTALYKLLNETKLGAMLDDLATQAITQGLARVEGEKPTADDILKLVRQVFADGFAFAVIKGEGPEQPQPLIVVRDGDRNGARAMVERLEARSDPKTTTETRGSRQLHVTGPKPDDMVWWVEGKDLLLASMVSVDPILAVLDGKDASATKHPIRVELSKPEPGVETALTAFFDLATVPMPPEAAQMGLDGVKRVDYRWGFQGDALYSTFRVVAPTPRRGLLTLVDSKAFPRFDKASLPAVPAGVNQWATLSLDPAPLWAWVSDQVKAAMPPGGNPPAMLAFEQAVPQILGGLRLKEDVLTPLGPRWTAYVDVEGFAKGGKGKTAITVDLRDSAAAATAVGRIVDVVGQILTRQAQQTGRPKPVEIVKVPGAVPAYRITLAAGTLPANLAGLAPAIVIGKKRLAIATDEAEARAATAAPDQWKPGPDFAPAIAKLPDNLVALMVSDPRAILPRQITSIPLLLGAMNAATMTQAKPGQAPFTIKLDPTKVPTAADIRSRLSPGTMAVSIDATGLKVVSRESAPSLSSPATASIAVALLLPAVQAAREAARRSQSVNNLKQVGLAMHTYEIANNTFPASAIVGKDGKPLLSWRVAILPYLGLHQLYEEFHLDEPWDSDHNKALIPRMPSVYLNPSTGSPRPGETHYLAFTGPNAALDVKPTGIKDFLDGTSFTVMVADSTRAVPWTKPEDTPFAMNAAPSLLGTGSPHPGGFNALFADGSVRFLKNTINAVVFKALVSRNGGEVIASDAF